MNKVEKSPKRTHNSKSKEDNRTKPILKQIKKTLNTNQNNDFIKLLHFFFDSRPSTDDYDDLQALIFNVVKARDLYKAVIDDFVFIIKSLDSEAKDRQIQPRNYTQYLKHLENIGEILRRDQIVVWIKNVKETLGGSRKRIKELQMQNRNLSKISSGQKHEVYVAEDSQLSTQSIIREEEIMKTATNAFKKAPVDSLTLKQIQEVTLKVDMLALKYQLSGNSTLSKIESIQQQMRRLTINLESQLYQRQKEVQKKYSQKIKQIKQEYDTLLLPRKVTDKTTIIKDRSNEAKETKIQKRKHLSEEKRFIKKNQTPPIVSPAVVEPTIVHVMKGFLEGSEIINQADKRSMTFLKNKIEKVAKFKPYGSQKLMSVDSSQGNKGFYKFHDKFQNILLLVKLKNGIVVGGFTKEGIQKESTNSNGFIFSLTRRQVFQKIKSPIISYDPQSIVFGKDQLRINANQLVLQSHFGCLQRHFNSSNKDIDYFLGCQNSHSAQITIYQVFQIVPE